VINKYHGAGLLPDVFPLYLVSFAVSVCDKDDLPKSEQKRQRIKANNYENSGDKKVTHRLPQTVKEIASSSRERLPD